MKIKGFLAGLGIAGKLALGVGVAAAATTGAGAAGVLPEPVQHAVSKAVGAVTPFTMPDPDHHGSGPDKVSAGEHSTTTTVEASTTTSVPKNRDEKHGNGDSNGVVTPTSVDEHHGEAATTTTLAPNGNGSNEGNGSNDGNTDGNGDNGGGHETTPTTVHHGDGDNNNPQALALHCEVSGANVTCAWNASTIADHHVYVLLRSGGTGNGRVVCSTEAGLTCTDEQGVPGTEYHYLVDSLRSDNSVSSHSNFVTLHFPGVPTTTTTVHHDGDNTTTTVGDHH